MNPLEIVAWLKRQEPHELEMIPELESQLLAQGENETFADKEAACQRAACHLKAADLVAHISASLRNAVKLLERRGDLQSADVLCHHLLSWTLCIAAMCRSNTVRQDAEQMLSILHKFELRFHV